MTHRAEQLEGRTRCRPSAAGAAGRFVAIAASVAVLLLLVARTGPFERHVKQTSLLWNTSVAALLLKALGEDVEVVGNRLGSSRFSVRVLDGCDAVEPLLLVTAAIVATPVPIAARALGIAWAAAALLLLNQVRIVTLYFTGVHAPRLFDLVHMDLWQALFIGFGIGAWLLWARWAQGIARRRRALA